MPKITVRHKSHRISLMNQRYVSKRVTKVTAVTEMQLGGNQTERRRRQAVPQAGILIVFVVFILRYIAA